MFDVVVFESIRIQIKNDKLTQLFGSSIDNYLLKMNLIPFYGYVFLDANRRTGKDSSDLCNKLRIILRVVANLLAASNLST